jgi:hypothetical protein
MAWAKRCSFWEQLYTYPIVIRPSPIMQPRAVLAMPEHPPSTSCVTWSANLDQDVHVASSPAQMKLVADNEAAVRCQSGSLNRAERVYR